jgi:ABC-type transport system involved in Fe-S cluster assembly fused permease/ATPase subunit
LRGQATSVPYSEISWSSIKQLIPYLAAYKARLGLAFSFLIAAKLASLGMPFLLKHAVDALDGGLSLEFWASLPLAFLLAYACARFANVLFSELRDTVFGRVTESAMRQIGLQVFKHLHALDLQFHLDRKTGGLARDIERGTSGISFLMRFLVFNIVPTLIEIVMVVVILSGAYSAWFGLIVACSIAAYVAYSIYATEIRTQHVREMNRADSDTNTRAIDSLLNYETVKYFGNEDYEAEHYDQNLARWQKARRSNRLSVFALNAGQAFIISFSLGAAMILAGRMVSSGEMTMGDFVLINAFMLQIFMPLNFLGFVYREIKGSLANIENMFSLLRIKPGIQNVEGATALELSQGKISFQDVDFSYDGERSILKGFCLNVAAKQKVALVGSSGSGKSTLSKLLFRFYDPNNGSVLIDDQDIKQVSLESLRSNLAFVPQDTVLFNASIYENIRYGNIKASEAEIHKAIDMAHLGHFIEQLPEGLETLVGERGLKLSGGEKQRVSIARAILKQPKILVFDEATSSLDSHTEKQIMAAIDDISRQRTVIIIAHRLSTISSADNIVVLNEGKVAEQGKHEELLSLGGLYSSMWQSQKRQEELY